MTKSYPRLIRQFCSSQDSREFRLIQAEKDHYIIEDKRQDSMGNEIWNVIFDSNAYFPSSNILKIDGVVLLALFEDLTLHKG